MSDRLTNFAALLYATAHDYPVDALELDAGDGIGVERVREVLVASQPEQVEHLDLRRILMEEVTFLGEIVTPARLATRLLMRGDIRITYTAQEG